VAIWAARCTSATRSCRAGRILETRTFALPVKDASEESRSLVYALVDAPVGKVPVLARTCRGASTPPTSARSRSARSTTSARGRAGGQLPAILMGDFNAEPDSDEIRFLRGLTALGGRSTYWADCFGLVGAGRAHVRAHQPLRATAARALRRIDYIFSRGRPAVRGERSTRGRARPGEGDVFRGPLRVFARSR